MIDESKKPNRDKRYIEKKKADGYVRISMWVKKTIINNIKELIHLEHMKDDYKDLKKSICPCYSEFLHGEAINICKCICHEENK